MATLITLLANNRSRGETQVDLTAYCADIIQVGARNMYVKAPLAKGGKKGKPPCSKSSRRLDYYRG